VFEDAKLGCRRSTPNEIGVDLLFGSNFYGIVKARHALLLQGFRHNNAIWLLNQADNAKISKIFNRNATLRD